MREVFIPYRKGVDRSFGIGDRLRVRQINTPQTSRLLG
jgi:hypothetical protein